MYIPDVLSGSVFAHISYLDKADSANLLLMSSVKSNRKDYLEAFNRSFAYEDSRESNKNKIYAVLLKIMFPRYSTSKDRDIFVHRLMESFKDKDGKRLYKKDTPYIYWFESVNGKSSKQSDYLYIMAGQREVYEHPTEEPILRKRPMYIHPKTHKYCSKNTPGVIVLEKNSPVIDTSTGKPKVKQVYVRSVKNRVFNYKDAEEIELKKATFKEFTENLKRLVLRILENMLGISSKTAISKLQTLAIYTFDKQLQKAKVILFNTKLRNFRWKYGFYRYFVEFLDKVQSVYPYFAPSEVANFKRKYKDLEKEMVTVFKEQTYQDKKMSNVSYSFPVRAKKQSFKSWFYCFQKSIRHLDSLCQEFEKSPIMETFKADADFRNFLAVC